MNDIGSVPRLCSNCKYHRYVENSEEVEESVCSFHRRKLKSDGEAKNCEQFAGEVDQ